MPSVEKCQAEEQADTNQVGGDFCRSQLLLTSLSAFQISFHPDWQIDNIGFLTGQSWRVLNPGTQVGPQNRDFGTVLQTALVSSVVQV